MIHRILFARDFSPSSERALAYGVYLAKRCDAEMHMVAVRVLSNDPFHPPEEPATALDRLREQFKERSRRSFRQRGFDPGSLHVHHAVMRNAAAAPAILNYAESHDIDLIVMGTHGRRGVRRVLLGSVAEEVVRLAPCPVFVAREDGRAAPPSIQRIVVPIDFSPPSRSAVEYAVRLAAHCSARVELVHAIADLEIPKEYGIEPIVITSPEVEERVQEELEKWAAAFGINDTATQARFGDPVRVVVDYADGEGDLIVLATRGRKGLNRVFVGSVAQDVIRRARRPVITARHFGPFLSAEHRTDQSGSEHY